MAGGNDPKFYRTQEILRNQKENSLDLLNKAASGKSQTGGIAPTKTVKKGNYDDILSKVIPASATNEHANFMNSTREQMAYNDLAARYTDKLNQLNGTTTTDFARNNTISSGSPNLWATMGQGAGSTLRPMVYGRSAGSYSSGGGASGSSSQGPMTVPIAPVLSVAKPLTFTPEEMPTPETVERDPKRIAELRQQIFNANKRPIERGMREALTRSYYADNPQAIIRGALSGAGEGWSAINAEAKADAAYAPEYASKVNNVNIKNTAAMQNAALRNQANLANLTAQNQYNAQLAEAKYKTDLMNYQLGLQGKQVEGQEFPSMIKRGRSFTTYPA